MWLKLETLLGKQKDRFSAGIEDVTAVKEIENIIKNIHPQASDFVKYKDVYNDTLYLSVSDSMWIGEMGVHKEYIKNIINNKRSKPVKDIKFTLS